jgi:hypothetical protein
VKLETKLGAEVVLRNCPRNTSARFTSTLPAADEFGRLFPGSAAQGWPRLLWPVVFAFLLLQETGSLRAQGTSAAMQDPMMQLMLAQPKIDVDSPVVPLTSFDPPAVKPGEEAIYRVTLNALETAIDWPSTIPIPAQVQWRAGAHAQILTLGGSLLVPRTTFIYRVRASAPGDVTIPEFTIPVNGKPVTIPATRLEVSTTPPPRPPAQQLRLEVPTNGLFVGQTVRARILLPAAPGGMLQSLAQAQLNGKGFIVDQASAHAHVEAMPLPGSRASVSAFVYELMLTPIAVGNLSIFAQGYAVGNRVFGGVIMPGPGGPMPQWTLVDSDPTVLQVRPLPRGSELPGFTGAVGVYAVDPPELSTNYLSVGEPLKLKVKVRGDGNLARLVHPPAPQQADWQVFAMPLETIPPQIIQAQGFVTLNYTLIPLTDKVRATPAIPFSTFDPDLAAYQNQTIPAVPVTVTAGAATAADLDAVIQAAKLDKQVEKDPVLSGLATGTGLSGGLMPVQKRGWFPLLHLVPAAGLMVLWSWDRRRRFLELHPDIVLRRRALRALRRERKTLQRAARSEDSARFATSAVQAMTVAVAPWYPAEPRALVGSDVLMMLTDADRSGPAGKTVRHVFSKTDAARFDAASPATTDLLQLRAEINTVLDHLESRLCN